MSNDDLRVTEQWSSVSGLLIFSRVSMMDPRHSNPHVVLIHGLAVSSRTFLPTLTCLAPSYRTYAIDLPGCGRSTTPERALDIAELADVTVAWMDANGIEQPVLVGHSMGCQVIAEIAHRYPDRLCCAVLAAPTGNPDARSPMRQLLQLALDALHEPPRLIYVAVRDYIRSGIRRSLATVRHMNVHPMVDRLSQVTLPTLLIVGERDPVVPDDWAAEVIARLPNGRTVEIPGGTHGMHFAAPEAVANAITAFIDDPGKARIPA